MSNTAEWWRNWYASLSPEKKAARQQASRDNYARNKAHRDARRRQHYYDNRAVQLRRACERQKRLWDTPEEIARRKANRARRRGKEKRAEYPLTAQEWRNATGGVGTQMCLLWAEIPSRAGPCYLHL